MQVRQKSMEELLDTLLGPIAARMKKLPKRSPLLETRNHTGDNRRRSVIMLERYTLERTSHIHRVRSVVHFVALAMSSNCQSHGERLPYLSMVKI